MGKLALTNAQAVNNRMGFTLVSAFGMFLALPYGRCDGKQSRRTVTRTVVVAANGQPLQKAETTDTFCSRFVDADLGLTTAGVLRIIPAVIAGYWLHRVLKTCSAGDTAMCIGLCGFVILMCIPSSLPF